MCIKVWTVFVLVACVLHGYDSHDFGVLGNYDSAVHTFRLRNVSGRNMRIGTVRSSCACAVGKVDFELIAPGCVASVTCRIDLNTLNGDVSKNFWVHLEWEGEDVVRPVRGVDGDGELLLTGKEQVIVLKMQGKVRTRVKLSSGEAFFRDEQDVELCLEGYAKSATFRKIVCPASSRFRWTVSDNGRRLVISPKGRLPSGSWVELWTLFIDDEKVHMLPLRVRSLLMGRIQAVPEQLHIGGNMSNSRRHVLLRCSDRNEDFKVVSARIEPEGMALETRRRGKGRWQVLIDGATVKKMRKGSRIVIHTDMDGQGEVVVPVVE